MVKSVSVTHGVPTVEVRRAYGLFQPPFFTSVTSQERHCPSERWLHHRTPPGRYQEGFQPEKDQAQVRFGKPPF